MGKYYIDNETGQRVQIHKTHKIRNFVVLPIAGLAVLGIIIGAAGGGGQISAPTAGTAGVAQADANTTTDSAPKVIRLGFGESHTWRGGETITVSQPSEHTESNPFLAAPDGKRYVSFDITIRNGGDDEYNVMTTTLTAQHDGRVAQQNYVAGDPLPNVQLPPGGETTFTTVYEIGAETGELQLSVQPNMFAADTVYFTGQF